MKPNDEINERLKHGGFIIGDNVELLFSFCCVNPKGVIIGYGSLPSLLKVKTEDGSIQEWISDYCELKN